MSRKASDREVSNTQHFDKPFLGAGYTVPGITVLSEAPMGC